MFYEITSPSPGQIPGINLSFRNITSTVRVKISFLILLIPVLLSVGCSAGYRYVSKGVVLPYKAEDLVLGMMEQEDRVSSFYASGTVLIKGWAWQSEADLLIAGTRTPLKIKIEITHPWGMPILHILIDNNRLEILSFDEKRIYIGDLTAESLSRISLPGGFCDHDLIWSVLRGYPHIAGHDRIVSPAMHRIKLMNQEGMDMETIDLSPETLLPARAVFPQDSLDISFSGFKENDGINYAQEVIVNNIQGGKDLVLSTKRIIFNNPVPDEIFILEKPQTFETVYMDEISDDTDR